MGGSMFRTDISALYEQHVARIKRIVEQEYSGCSAIFDRGAWPLFRFHIEDGQGAIVSKPQAFSLAELEGLSDKKLRMRV
jgi:hypothetical protein